MNFLRIFFLAIIVLACKKDEGQQISIVNHAVNGTFWYNERTLKHIEKEVSAPGGHKYEVVLLLARKIVEIRSKAFISKNDTLVYKSREKAIQYANELFDYSQRDTLLKEVFARQEFIQSFKKDIKTLEKADSDLGFQIALLKITNYEGELMNYSAGLIGASIDCYDCCFFKTSYDSLALINKPYYFSFTIKNVFETEEDFLKENLSKAQFTLNGKLINDDLEIKKVSHSYIIRFVPKAKGNYKFSAIANRHFEFNSDFNKYYNLIHQFQVKN